jgi:hypothetical protein
MASIEKSILKRFPRARELAWDRLFLSGKKTFFDNKKRLPKYSDYSDEFIAASLFLAQLHAHRAGLDLDLSAEEKIILGKSFKNPVNSR